MLVLLYDQVIVNVRPEPPLTVVTAHGYVLTVEGAITVTEVDTAERVFEGTDPAAVAKLEGMLRGNRFIGVDFDAGHLLLSLTGGFRLYIAPDASYESWSVAGPAGLPAVCRPHGELAIWKSRVTSGQDRPMLGNAGPAQEK